MFLRIVSASFTAKPKIPAPGTEKLYILPTTLGSSRKFKGKYNSTIRKFKLVLRIFWKWGYTIRVVLKLMAVAFNLDQFMEGFMAIIRVISWG